MGGLKMGGVMSGVMSGVNGRCIRADGCRSG